jgi:hypothetical protein
VSHVAGLRPPLLPDLLAIRSELSQKLVRHELLKPPKIAIMYSVFLKLDHSVVEV